MAPSTPVIQQLGLPSGLDALSCAMAEIRYPVAADVMQAQAESLCSPAPKAHWHAGRLSDYVAGRMVAEYLLPEHSDRSLVAGSSGAPIWPKGLIGSISHSRRGPEGYALAIVAPSTRCRSMGIDTQFHPGEGPRPALLERVCLPGEWEACANISDAASRFAVIFSAKESAYKALHGLLPSSSGISLGYHSVRLEHCSLRSGMLEMTLIPEVCEATGLESSHILHVWSAEERVCSLMSIPTE